MVPHRANPPIRGRRAPAALAALATFGALAAVPAGAATVVEKTITIAIQPGGAVREHVRLQVRLEAARDLDRWSVVPIYMDDNRTLGAVEAYVLQPDGRREKLRRRDRDTVDWPGDGVLHGSGRFHLLDFTGLRAGSVLVVDYQVEERPYFPAGVVSLAEDDPIERLRVEVSGGGAGWRWRLDGPAVGIAVAATAGGVVVTARDLAAPDPPELAPGGAAVYPVLRYGWGGDGSWAGVGRWFNELLASLPRGTSEVRARARGLTAGAAGPRQRLEALLGFARREVRYVAVEIGIGGYRPSPPGEVLTRKWGDCKDKALLLIDLLADAGIAAYPALVLADPDRRIDRDFPSPLGFNHMIVAVPADAVPLADGDPVGDGFLFLDPTQTQGAARWLNTWVQDQDALVVRDGGGGLARTPSLPAVERRSLVVNLNVDAAGEALGGAGLAMRGELAAGFLTRVAAAPPQQTEEDVRTIFTQLLAGATLGRVGWTAGEGEVPALDLSAAVRIPGLLQGAGGRASVLLPAMRLTPDPGLVTDRRVPMALAPRSLDVTWHLNLPAGCRSVPTADEPAVDNAVGTFRQSVTTVESKLIVERRAELHRRWIEPELLPALHELAVAEHRALRRRIRVDCGGGSSAAGPAP